VAKAEKKICLADGGNHLENVQLEHIVFAFVQLLEKFAMIQILNKRLLPTSPMHTSLISNDRARPIQK